MDFVFGRKYKYGSIHPLVKNQCTVTSSGKLFNLFCHYISRTQHIALCSRYLIHICWINQIIFCISLSFSLWVQNVSRRSIGECSWEKHLEGREEGKIAGESVDLTCVCTWGLSQSYRELWSWDGPKLRQGVRPFILAGSQRGLPSRRKRNLGWSYRRHFPWRGSCELSAAHVFSVGECECERESGCSTTAHILSFFSIELYLLIEV